VKADIVLLIVEMMLILEENENQQISEYANTVRLSILKNEKNRYFAHGNVQLNFKRKELVHCIIVGKAGRVSNLIVLNLMRDLRNI
jgi:hypothetical protein